MRGCKEGATVILENVKRLCSEYGVFLHLGQNPVKLGDPEKKKIPCLDEGQGSLISKNTVE